MVQSPGSKYAIAMGAELLHRVIEDLRNRNKPRSHQTDKHISRLKDEDIEILNSQIDRHTVVVWIWCHSQAAIEYIQKMYESNQLRSVFSQLGDFPPSAQCAHRLIQSEVTRIDNNQFKRTVGSYFWKCNRKVICDSIVGRPTKYKFYLIKLISIKLTTILSVPFCPYHLSNTILSGHQKGCHA